MIRQRITLFSTAAIMIVSMLAPLKVSALSGSDFKPGRIIDDSIFINKDSMTVQQIQDFLNAKVPVCSIFHSAYNAENPPPYTCLKDYQENTTTGVNNFGSFNGSTPVQVVGGKTAAQIIWEAAQAYNINPQVLIVLLQKEQGLVTDDWPLRSQYTKATGYLCPDTAACNSNAGGFGKQVFGAAWQFRNDFNGIGTPGFWSAFAKGNNNIPYSPVGSCGTKSVFIETQATAVLYKYTPYTPTDAALASLNDSTAGGTANCGAYGNRNFWWYFNKWFGASTGYYCTFNVIPSITSGIEFGKTTSRADQAIFNIYSGTSTNCIEAHTWNSGMNSWQSNVASNHPVVIPPGAEVQYADLNGDGKDEAILIGAQNTGSGKIEFHVWNPGMRSWQNHIISNMPLMDMTNSAIKFVDFDGDGKDEAVLIVYSGTGSGMIEFHVWNPGMGTWRWHIATNQVVGDPTKLSVDFADLNGDGKDEAVLIGFQATSTSMIEFHVWNPGMWSWQTHIASNHPIVTPDNAEVRFADLNGDGKDEGLIVGKKSTGSGKFEFHVWNPGMTSWQSHIASNQLTLQ